MRRASVNDGVGDRARERDGREKRESGEGGRAIKGRRGGENEGDREKNIEKKEEGKKKEARV